ncbi:hypothetical protein B7P43_G06237 [Cryptotermes secundus]|uniref:Serum response factor-binding protein 1 n=1 Tax=Cryptotermes secundus TaxID=105785 RepID=A0A2J7RJW2_9NEOP|nr:serum response factor-binding protein 1 isoform X2 [Cryptotermes secundus]PNF41099.1 hypothetical protein B7P43_G06237 [Cryptotermes secundus]
MIVSMRQQARKAKLYTINKLIRESRRLKSRNGPEEQKKKYNKKAERLMEEMLILKKLKDDEVSKFALCNTKKASEIIADPAVPLKEKALARVSNQSNISACVTQFHMKFPAWVDIVPQLLLKLGEKARKKKNRKLKIRENDRGKVTVSSKTEICTHESICSKDQTVMYPNCDESVVIHNQDRQQEMPKDLSEKISKESVCLKSETRSLAEVKRFTELLKAKNDTENDSLDVINLTSVASSCGTTVDPFFMCEDGKTEYLTSVKVDTSSNEGVYIHERERLSKSARNKSDEKRFFQAERRKSMQEQKPKNSSFKAFQQQSTNISGNRSKQSSYSRQKISVIHHEKKQSPLTDNNSPIHPSWEAKKKLKEQQCAVFAFQGKKIKFDD